MSFHFVITPLRVAFWPRGSNSSKQMKSAMCREYRKLMSTCVKKGYKPARNTSEAKFVRSRDVPVAKGTSEGAQLRGLTRHRATVEAEQNLLGELVCLW